MRLCSAKSQAGCHLLCPQSLRCCHLTPHIHPSPRWGWGWGWGWDSPGQWERHPAPAPALLSEADHRPWGGSSDTPAPAHPRRRAGRGFERTVLCGWGTACSLTLSTVDLPTLLCLAGSQPVGVGRNVTLQGEGAHPGHTPLSLAALSLSATGLRSVLGGQVLVVRGEKPCGRQALRFRGDRSARAVPRASPWLTPRAVMGPGLRHSWVQAGGPRFMIHEAICCMRVVIAYTRLMFNLSRSFPGCHRRLLQTERLKQHRHTSHGSGGWRSAITAARVSRHLLVPPGCQPEPRRGQDKPLA